MKIDYRIGRTDWLKRTLVTTCTLLALLCASAPAEAAYDEVQGIVPEGIEITGYDADKDYMALMLQCAEEGSENSLTLGAIYEAQRNLKIIQVGANYGQTNFFDSYDVEEIKKELNEYNNPVESEEPEEPEKTPVMYYTDDDTVMLAKLLHQECGSVYSDTEKACVVWTVLNRADRYGQSIYDTVTSPGQFAYYSSTPVRSELYNLAQDVLYRWNLEKNGQSDVGRVLPSDYMWFYGDGSHNYFRNAYSSGYSTWDYSLPSPYES